MKKILYILGVAVAMTFASCQKDNLGAGGSDGDGAVAFSAESISPLTRVSGDEWQKGDEIGITQRYTEGGSVICDNIKYLAAEDGATVSLSPSSEIICHLDGGVETDYLAYYPYQKSWSYEDSNMIFDLSAQDGSQLAQNKVDLLLGADDCKTQGESVVFQFAHYLSKVQITVSNHDDFSIFENLDALTATIYTKSTQYNVLERAVVSSEEQVELEMVDTSNDGETVIFTAIIAPGEVSDEIIFSDGESNYIATLAISSAASGKQYNFTAVVGDQGLTIVKLTDDGVTEWDSQEESTLDKDIEIVDDIYQIYTASGLEAFACMVNSGNTSINGKLMSDINLGGSESNQWTPIGDEPNQYTGTFFGSGYEVSGLYINGSSSYQALFGYTNSAEIYNVGVDGNMTGENYVGGIVGAAISTSIINCYNKAMVTGSSYVGGVVGSAKTNSSIINCYNSVAIDGTSYVGGVAGEIEDATTATSCYYDSTIHSGSGIGSGDGDVLGYSTADMHSSRLLYHLNNSAYDYNLALPEIEAYGWKEVVSGYPVFDRDNKPTYNRFDLVYESESEVYQIYSANGLRLFADLVNGYDQSVTDVVCDADQAELDFGTTHPSINGELMNNVDLGGDEEDEFAVIGEDDSRYFSGKFNGGGNEISGLYIDNLSGYKGVFGYTDGATIENLGVSGSITSFAYVGGIVGCATGTTTINNCYNKATILAGYYTGGIAGYVGDNSTITNCYNDAKVYGDNYDGLDYKGSFGSVGGIVGEAYKSTISSCYNRGEVFGKNSEYTATNGAGGVVGTSQASTITYCYSAANVVESTVQYGGIVGVVTASSSSGCSTISYCYYDSGLFGGSAIGDYDDDTYFTNYGSKSTTDMTDGEFATTLGSAFMEDTGINDGYPILTWQVTE